MPAEMLAGAPGFPGAFSGALSGSEGDAGGGRRGARQRLGQNRAEGAQLLVAEADFVAVIGGRPFWGFREFWLF